MTIKVIHILDGRSQAAKWALCGYLAVRGTHDGERIRIEHPYLLDQEMGADNWRYCRRCEQVDDARARQAKTG